LSEEDWTAILAILDEFGARYWPELYGIRRTHKGLMHYLNLEAGSRKNISPGRIEADEDTVLIVEAMQLHRTFQDLVGSPHPDHDNGVANHLSSSDCPMTNRGISHSYAPN